MAGCRPANSCGDRDAGLTQSQAGHCHKEKELSTASTSTSSRRRERRKQKRSRSKHHQAQPPWQSAISAVVDERNAASKWSTSVATRTSLERQPEKQWITAEPASRQSAPTSVLIEQHAVSSSTTFLQPPSASPRSSSPAVLYRSLPASRSSVARSFTSGSSKPIIGHKTTDGSLLPAKRNAAAAFEDFSQFLDKDSESSKDSDADSTESEQSQVALAQVATSSLPDARPWKDLVSPTIPGSLGTTSPTKRLHEDIRSAAMIMEQHILGNHNNSSFSGRGTVALPLKGAGVKLVALPCRSASSIPVADKSYSFRSAHNPASSHSSIDSQSESQERWAEEQLMEDIQDIWQEVTNLTRPIPPEIYRREGSACIGMRKNTKSIRQGHGWDVLGEHTPTIQGTNTAANTTENIGTVQVVDQSRKVWLGSPSSTVLV